LKLIVGLGNPGKQFEKNRHNIGFRILRAFARKRGLTPWVRRGNSRFILHADFTLLLPLTFMNRSGIAVKKWMIQLGVSPSEILVIHDDVDIEFGEIRFKSGGSSGGHKGLNSIISEIKTQDFSRLRFGIGKDPDFPTEEFVLQDFSPEEEGRIQVLLESAIQGLDLWLEEGIEACMNRFNRKNLLSP
jgi:PTH1 family peptidyl-tRNA hydrolase